MSAAAKHTPGPWLVSRSLFVGDYGALRYVGPGQIETLNDKRGRERRFKTAAAAQAAIAKATT